MLLQQAEDKQPEKKSILLAPDQHEPREWIGRGGVIICK
jgi:hypothetical protein